MHSEGSKPRHSLLPQLVCVAVAFRAAGAAAAATVDPQVCAMFGPPPVVRTDLKRIGDTNFYNDTLKLRGEADLPANVHFSGITPLEHGATVSVIDSAGISLFTISLPPGMYRSEIGYGWIPNSAKTRWRFRANADTAPNGIRSVRIDDRSNVVPGRVRVVVEGRNGSYPITVGQKPITVRVIFDGETGLCVETGFSADDCVFSSSGGALRCRQ